MPNPALSPFKPEHFAREDSADDALFYVPERLVQHLDDDGRAAITAFYAEHLPAGGRVLDLMSSWISHLPQDMVFDEVVPASVRGRPTPSEADAQADLLEEAGRCHGVGTAADLADYHRISLREARPRLDDLVDQGRLVPAAVDGWDDLRGLGLLVLSVRVVRPSRELEVVQSEFVVH